MSGRVLSAGPVSSEGDARPARWMTLTAGAFAGAFEACLVFPVENVKTQLQLPRTPPFAGPLDCIRTTLRTHGPAGFYTGISAAATGAIVKASVRFFTFDSIKRAAFRVFPLPPPPAPGVSAPTRSRAHAPLVTVLSGLAAGVVEAVVAVTPSECIKTKLIHDRAQSAPQHGSLTALVGAIAREEGIRGFYHGLGPTVVRQGANQAVRFSVYTAAAAAMMRRNASKAAGSSGKAGKTDLDGEGGAVGQLGSGQALLAGALAGFVSVYVTMPIDVVKTRMQSLATAGAPAGSATSSSSTAAPPTAARPRGAVSCLKDIAGREGVLALWRGTSLRLARVTFSSAITFAAYERALALLVKTRPSRTIPAVPAPAAAAPASAAAAAAAGGVTAEGNQGGALKTKEG